MNIPQLLVRAGSGIIYIALIIAAVFLGYPGMLCLIALFAVVASAEFGTMVQDDKENLNYPIMAIDALCTMCLALGSLGFTMWLWILFFLLRIVTQLYLHDPAPLKCIALSALSQIWIGLPLLLMSLIGLKMNGNYMFVLAAFIMIWTNDTGAYLVGSQFGKRRLFERLSPKKSWEGFWGGLILVIALCIVLGLCCPDAFDFQHGVWAWIGAGIITVVFSTWGDLFESMIKRSLHLKDSSHLIPGHGGLLDRIDSMLFVMPALFLYLQLIH